MSKPLHPGRAAEGGLLAAQLAARGITGSLDILEGDAGFGRAMGRAPDWSRVGETLGDDFHVGRLTFKNHIGCGHTFPAIDGALELQRLHGIDADAIEGVAVATYQPALDVACYMNPTTDNEARFSIPFVVARALVHGSVRLAAFEPKGLHDPRTRSLMQRVSVTVDPEIDAGFPGKRAARVEFLLRDGRRLSHLQRHRKGDPEQPLTDHELEGKFLELAEPVIGAEAAASLVARLWLLDRAQALP